MLKGLAQTAPVDNVAEYFAEIARVCSSAKVTDAEGRSLSLPSAFHWVAERSRTAQQNTNKLIIIGNGGSAAIASHQAIEFLKNGGIRALALNDGASLTAIANDFGYQNVFAEQVRMLGRKGDVLVAISSSGQSTNILKAVETARSQDMSIITYTGFRPDNLLRSLGDVNFYVDSNQYGFVEIAHHALIQAVLDLHVIPSNS